MYFLLPKCYIFVSLKPWKQANYKLPDYATKNPLNYFFRIKARRNKTLCRSLLVEQSMPSSTDPLSITPLFLWRVMVEWCDRVRHWTRIPADTIMSYALLKGLFCFKSWLCTLKRLRFSSFLLLAPQPFVSISEKAHYKREMLVSRCQRLLICVCFEQWKVENLIIPVIKVIIRKKKNSDPKTSQLENITAQSAATY